MVIEYNEDGTWYSTAPDTEVKVGGELYLNPSVDAGKDLVNEMVREIRSGGDKGKLEDTRTRNTLDVLKCGAAVQKYFPASISASHLEGALKGAKWLALVTDEVAKQTGIKPPCEEPISAIKPDIPFAVATIHNKVI